MLKNTLKQLQIVEDIYKLNYTYIDDIQFKEQDNNQLDQFFKFNQQQKQFLEIEETNLTQEQQEI